MVHAFIHPTTHFRKSFCSVSFEDICGSSTTERVDTNKRTRTLTSQVGYVHGGKYQFDQTYNVAHQFAGSGQVSAQVC